MAKPVGVWGIDMGQCALKALHCTKDGDNFVADAFDYIEYPKMLNQPEADPDELVAEALEQFLSRNDVKGSRVAISVAGQNGLAKFFKPPPVDAKKIPEIVAYEAKQQIPFDLNDVIWDFQQMKGGAEVDGFALDAEVGLFAMKREQVFRTLEPYQKADVDIDIIQLAPIAIYNFVASDLMTDLPDPDEFDPEDPPPSLVILSTGTDTTDLVITNGFRVWQRSIPIGGNHFTRQLTKELKLTFAKAEHLKRNARQSEDPKKVFQAMRSVFNDLVTEVQRSINFFQSIDRQAKVKGVVMLGNTTRLPGLQQYMGKNLGIDVIKFEKFNNLEGSGVVSSPAFKDNMPAFGVSYGLCLQALGDSSLQTNLLPKEIITERIIEAKKPWAVAAVAALMLACSFNFFFHFRNWSKVEPERADGAGSWSSVGKLADRATSRSGDEESTHGSKMATIKKLVKLGDEVAGQGDRRLLWLEMLAVQNHVLPRDQKRPPDLIVRLEDYPLNKRPELYITSVETQHFTDLSKWFTPAAEAAYRDGLEALAMLDAGQNPAPAGDKKKKKKNKKKQIKKPKGPGWVIQLEGYHDFNNDLRTEGPNYVRATLIRNLERMVVTLPGYNQPFTMKEYGIMYPILSYDSGRPVMERVNLKGGGGSAGGGMAGGGGGMAGAGGGMAGAGGGMAGGKGGQTKGGNKGSKAEKKSVMVKRYKFTVQYAWQPKRLEERIKERAEANKKKKKNRKANSVAQAR